MVPIPTPIHMETFRAAWRRCFRIYQRNQLRRPWVARALTTAAMMLCQGDGATNIFQLYRLSDVTMPRKHEC